MYLLHSFCKRIHRTEYNDWREKSNYYKLFEINAELCSGIVIKIKKILVQ